MSSGFSRKLFDIVSQIPAGRVSTYKDIAAASGIRGIRAAGQILASNKRAPLIPCHRVVLSDGRIGGYSGPGGPSSKKKLLMNEGIKFTGDKLACFSELVLRADFFE